MYSPPRAAYMSSLQSTCVHHCIHLWVSKGNKCIGLPFTHACKHTSHLTTHLTHLYSSQPHIPILASHTTHTHTLHTSHTSHPDTDTHSLCLTHPYPHTYQHCYSCPVWDSPLPMKHTRKRPRSHSQATPVALHTHRHTHTYRHTYSLTVHRTGPHYMGDKLAERQVSLLGWCLDGVTNHLHSTSSELAIFHVFWHLHMPLR